MYFDDIFCKVNEESNMNIRFRVGELVENILKIKSSH